MRGKDGPAQYSRRCRARPARFFRDGDNVSGKPGTYGDTDASNLFASFCNASPVSRCTVHSSMPTAPSER